MGFRRRKGGEGGYIRIQNKSSHEVTIEVIEGRNVDDMGMDGIQGTIAPGEQLPSEGGKSPFEDDPDAIYQYIEGDVKNRFQRDGFFELKASCEDSEPSSLKLIVDHNSWESEDTTPDKNSKICIMADIDEEDDEWKIEIRVYNHYDPKCWMGTLEDHIRDKQLNMIGLPGTHDSGTYAFDEEKGAAPDSDLTSTIADILDRGRILSKLNDFIMRKIFERLCQCQAKSFKEQLEEGVRYLDMRVARHAESGEFWTCHGVFCVNMVDAMAEITEFLNENPKEIVLLDFKALYEMDDHHEEFLTIIFDALGDKAADLDSGISHKATVGEFWDNGYQAVVFYKKQKDVSGDAFGRKVWPRWIESPWPNTSDVDELHDKLTEYVADRRDDLYFVLQGVLTPNVEMIKDNLFGSDEISIRTFAIRTNPRIMDWCENEFMGKAPLNIVMVDFYQSCCIIQAIINYNRND